MTHKIFIDDGIKFALNESCLEFGEPLFEAKPLEYRLCPRQILGGRWIIFWWQEMLTYSLVTLTVFTMFSVQLIKTIQDLCTKERRSVAKYRAKTVISRLYKITLILVLISLFISCFFGLLPGVLQMFTYFTVYNSETFNCLNLMIIVFWGYLGGRTFMYLIFLFRVHHVYKGSVYKYNEKTLYLLGIYFTVPVSLFCVGAWWRFEDSAFFLYKRSDIASNCAGNFRNIFLIPYLLYDISLNVITVILFVKPLRQLIKAQLRTNDTHKMDKQTRKMGYIGRKYLLLGIVTSISTVGNFVALRLLDELTIVPFDILINATCVILFTPYYPDKQYFNRICCCCVKIFECFECCCRGIHHENFTKERSHTRTSRKSRKRLGTVSHRESTYGSRLESETGTRTGHGLNDDSRTRGYTFEHDYTPQPSPITRPSPKPALIKGLGSHLTSIPERDVKIEMNDFKMDFGSHITLHSTVTAHDISESNVNVTELNGRVSEYSDISDITSVDDFKNRSSIPTKNQVKSISGDDTYVTTDDEQDMMPEIHKALDKTMLSKIKIAHTKSNNIKPNNNSNNSDSNNDSKNIRKNGNINSDSEAKDDEIKNDNEQESPLPPFKQKSSTHL